MRKAIILILFIYFTIITAYAADDIIFMIAPHTIEFNVENPNGLITGYTSNGVVNNIIDWEEYAVNMIPSLEGPKTPYEKYHSTGYSCCVSNKVVAGIYKLQLYGISIPYNTKIYISYGWLVGKGVKGPKYDNYKLVYPNSVWTYEFEVTPSVPAYTQIMLTKVSTPADLIKDMTTAGQLGYIGSSKFVSELTKEINEIEAEKAKGKIDDGLTPAQKAKKEYTELLKDITEKYNKPESDEYVKQEAYTVLREDMEYIIGHL